MVVGCFSKHFTDATPALHFTFYLVLDFGVYRKNNSI